MAELALVTPRTAVQGGHGLALKTMFHFTRVLLTRMNAAAGVGCLGYGFLSWASLAYGLEAQRLCDEVPSRGFPCVTPVLRFKA